MEQTSNSEDDSKNNKEIDTIHSISNILQTGLSRSSVAVIASLIESGIDPESLVDGEYELVASDRQLFLGPICCLISSD